MSRRLVLVFAALVFGWVGRAGAHRPIFSDQPGTDPKTAVPVSEPEVSQVIYRELTDAAPQLWLTLTVAGPHELYVQLGLPALERLRSFRPQVLVVGPGLPEIAAPITLPEGAGAVAFSTQDVAEPRFFHEPFTRTDSWILGSWTVSLPQAGRYYVVACDPSGQRGKLWLSVGRKERFSVTDWLSMGEWTRRIRAFHETDQTASPSRSENTPTSDRPAPQKRRPREPREGTEWCNVWIPHANNEDLPRVLLVGDSITQQYYGHVAAALEGKAHCAYVTTSWSVCNPAFRTQLEVVLSQYDFAAIHFNNGLHGFGYTEPQYEQALKETLTWLAGHCPSGRLIVANSTPIRPGPERAATNDRIRRRNEIVAALAEEMGLRLNDLHTPMIGQGQSYTDDYHFADGARRIQATQVARHITEALTP